MSELYGEESLAVLEQQIDTWLADMASANPAIDAVDRGDGDETRWYVRLRGDEKEFTTVWLTLGQRTLRYETYVMPAPLDHAEQLYETALRANASLVGAHFAIGVEDAVFLVGEVLLKAVDEAELDRVIGSLYAYVERYFPAMIRLGYARHFRNDS